MASSKREQLREQLVNAFAKVEEQFLYADRLIGELDNEEPLETELKVRAEHETVRRTLRELKEQVADALS